MGEYAENQSAAVAHAELLAKIPKITVSKTPNSEYGPSILNTVSLNLNLSPSSKDHNFIFLFFKRLHTSWTPANTPSSRGNISAVTIVFSNRRYLNIS